MTEAADEHRSVRRSLTALMGELSNSERKVARALLAQYPAAGLTTVAGLAAAAGVSAPTVVRFVARLGFSGFPAFQAALVHEVHEQMGSPLKQFASKGRLSQAGALRDTRASFEAMVNASYDQLPESEYHALVTLLSEVNRDVRVVGGRFSHVLAEYLVLHLRLVRPRVQVLANNHQTDRSLALVDTTASTVVVVFDYRRYDTDLAGLAQAASDRGATVALMTDTWLSPIAQIAKVVLPCHVDCASPFDSLVAAMALTESLVAGVSERLGATGMRRLEAIEAISEQSGSVAG